jgi:DNA-binding response OmpR family regulator
MATVPPRKTERPMRVLVVEDDVKLADLLERSFVDAGVVVERCADGAAGLAALQKGHHDVCILDGRLPGLDGFDVLADARAKGVAIPILMLTARDAVTDRVRGLELGADDYLVKPFAFAELLARVRALLRRSTNAAGPGSAESKAPARATATWADIVVDPVEYKVTRAGASIELSAKQFLLFATLVSHGREVLSRRWLLAEVFGYSYDPGTNIVDVHIAQLRRRLDRPGEASCIETVRGVGYRMAEPRNTKTGGAR